MNATTKGMTMNRTREVSQDVFFKAIGPRDIITKQVGPYPYTSVFTTRRGLEVGRIEPGPKPNNPEENKKYILIDVG